MKKIKNLGIIIISVGMALILAFTLTVNILALGMFDNLFEQFIGKTDDTLRGDTLGADVQYVKSAFSSPKELYEFEEGVCAEIAQEGITLLKNEDSTLPLKKGTTLSLFSHSSVDLVSGGSGSGSGSFELTKNLREGLEHAGLKVNDRLWNFYSVGAGSGEEYTRGVGSINYGRGLDWNINEVPLSVITADKELTASFAGTTAMFVLSRTGGEGADEARDMAAFGGKSGQHYLEPDDTELEIIDYLNKNFEDVILLVNCNNAMELGWVANYPNITAVLNMPGAGRTGVYGLGNLLVGEDEEGNEISPSGHLVDTFVYDNFSSPATQNMGDYRYDGTDYYYVNYAEGIYVGYKYYETRYEDVVCSRPEVGTYDYASTVLYPFGYGLSYTSFVWSNFEMTEADADGNITVSLDVFNNGDRRGKEVVQVYVQAPYTAYGVEKSSVVLVGFAKTDYVEPQGTANVEITVNLRDFTSYDANGAKTYILEQGNYYVTAASDAHRAVNNVLTARAEAGDTSVDTNKMTAAGDASFVGTFEQAQTDKTTYAATVSGEGTVTNLFDGAKLTDTPYLSRSKWSVMENNGLRYGTPSSAYSAAEIGGKQFSHGITAELKAQLDSKSSGNPSEGKVSETYTFGKKNGIDLIDLRGLSFDDPLWEDLLDQITLKELAKLVAECGYCSPEVKSINKPKVTDLDGPAGLNLVVGHGSVDLGDGYKAMTWPTEYLLACTWETDYAQQMGEGIGEDGLYSGVVGWYGPAVNIHRTPFAGRNFEYYSEDSFISGAMGKAAIYGAATKGMYAYLKHFALNDQETHRDHLGLVTWADEQTIREIYLKPFEMCIKDNTVTVNYNEAVKDEEGNITGYTMKTAEMPAATAIMSSFNRIGTIWAGGNYNLITGVLRNEWGFNGFVITDYEVTSYMFTDQCLAAGGDAKLTTVDWSKYSLEGRPEYQAYARNAAHHILYTVVNSAGMNGYVHGVEFVAGFAYYKIIIIVLDVVAAAGIGVLIWRLVLRVKKLRKGEPAVQEAQPEEGGQS